MLQAPRARQDPDSAGGVRAPAEVGDFKEGVGGFLRSSKEGERCKEGENLLESSKEGKEGEKQRQPPRTSELGARQ